MKKTFLSAFASTLALLITSFQTSAQEPVDLGLSVMWATTNLGASEPYEEGGHFAWGEISAKEQFGHERYRWEHSDKYKKRNRLDPADDAARVILGDKWHIPDFKEWKELIDNCTWTWEIKENGMEGYRVESKINQKSIFIPAGRPWGNLEPKGVYWSSVKKGDSPIVLTIDRNRHGLYITPGACWGHSIRPVCD